ncbi:MAG: peptide deformylase [Deltaproteobacteria bacterium]|nr:peptide deformylase [Deltaproteobacteria bacterium]
MSILKIARLGHPVLRQVAAPVDPAELGGPELSRLIADMLETVDAADGAGLAAPQVHVSKRVVVLQLSRTRGMEVWINPVLTPLTDERLASTEGCLSVPGLLGVVARPAAVRVEALRPDGSPLLLELEGFAAVVAQHECDHLDGVIYVDKVEPHTLGFAEELRRAARQRQATDAAEAPDDDLIEDEDDDLDDEEDEAGA